LDWLTRVFIAVFLRHLVKEFAVFLRRIRPRGRGRAQSYWVLLESYRTAKGSRQRVVCYLGKLSARQLSGWQTLTRRLGGPAVRPAELFDPPRGEVIDDDDPQLVAVNRLTLHNVREFGSIWLAWTLWRLLGLDELLNRQMPPGQEEVPWPTVAAILCIARFCHPSSELFIERQFYPQSALEDLLGVPSRQVHTDRLYAGLDKLLEHKTEIERHLRERLTTLFELSYEILLYDLTSTYFEGQCVANPMARRGYSRDSRPDCLQVVIALIVTSDGYPMGHEIFDGNTADSKTVQEIVNKVEQEHGKAKRIWVMDRGNVSEENLKYIRSRGGRYLVGTPKAMLRQVRGELTEQGWQEVREGLKVKRVALPDHTQDTLILCRSEDRVAKEVGMLERFVKRLEAGLQKLKASIDCGRTKDLGVAQVRLGRLLEKNWRAGECFAVTIQQQEQKLTIHWTQDESKKKQLCGHYLLRTNVTESDPATLWRQYMQLVDAEWAFRISKDELGLRPIWHQNADRVKGHILVCFIAYAMWKTLSGWMRAGGLGDAPRELLEEIKTIKCGDVRLPTRRADGSNGAMLQVRCVARPDKHVEVLLERLGLDLPNHLRREWLTPAPTPANAGV
jgi:transposase